MCYGKNSNNKTRITKNLFVWGFVFAVATVVAAADVEQGLTEAAGNEALYAAAADVGGGVVGGSAGKPIQSIKFEEDFGVRKALAMLGSMYQKNIVPTPNVDGQLAFRSLTNVTFEEAMDAILGENFKYEQDGKLIKVFTKDEYKKLKEDPDRMIYKVFTVYYITAAEAEKLVMPVLSPSAQIVSSTPAEKEISGGAGSASSSSRGGSSSGGSGASLDSSGGGDSMALNDTIVIYDYPENIAQVEAVLERLDVKPKQVLVEATILSALLTEGLQLGIDWNTLNGVAVDSIANIGSGAAEGLAQSGLATAVTGGGLSVGITSDHVAAFVRALETVTDTTVLANPKVLALNKQEGSVLIGQNLGYRSSTTIGQGGVATEGEVQFLETGTQLVFRPYIGNDGYIRMEIYPKDSSAELDSDGVPQETTTELKTNILVKNGETIVIGGLFRDVITTTRNQLPLLGNLPAVGALFRHTSDTSTREEVIILLTTRIIEDPSETDGDARAEDVSRKRFGARDERQWIGRAKLAEDHYAQAAKYYSEDDNASAMQELDAALKLRPAYLEAIRLKERIVAEERGQEALEKLERNMVENIDHREAPTWLRK